MPGHTGQITSASVISADGSLAAGAYLDNSKEIWIYVVPGDQKLKLMLGPKGESSNGHVIVSVG